MRRGARAARCRRGEHCALRLRAVFSAPLRECCVRGARGCARTQVPPCFRRGSGGSFLRAGRTRRRTDERVATRTKRNADPPGTESLSRGRVPEPEKRCASVLGGSARRRNGARLDFPERRSEKSERVEIDPGRRSGKTERAGIFRIREPEERSTLGGERVREPANNGAGRDRSGRRPGKTQRVGIFQIRKAEERCALSVERVGDPENLNMLGSRRSASRKIPACWVRVGSRPGRSEGAEFARVGDLEKRKVLRSGGSRTGTNETSSVRTGRGGPRSDALRRTRDVLASDPFNARWSVSLASSNCAAISCNRRASPARCATPRRSPRHVLLADVLIAQRDPPRAGACARWIAEGPSYPRVPRASRVRSMRSR